MQGKRPWYNIGFDETNNDAHPAIYVAAFSSFHNDIKIHDKPCFSKTRKNHEKDNGRHRKISRILNTRDYSFLFYSETDKKLLKRPKKLGIILSSLIYNQPRRDHVNILVDGRYHRDEINFAIDILHERIGLEKDCINFSYGPAFDRRVKLVNIADEVAHWLANSKSLRQLTLNKKQKQIIYDWPEGKFTLPF